MPDNKSTAALVSATLREHATPLNERTDAIISASKSMAAQKQTLARDTRKLSRRAEELEKTIGQSVDQLKEMGDLQNWAEVVFRDISVIEETLRMVEEEEGQGGQREEGSDGSGTRTI